jgi:hypothetical protein
MTVCNALSADVSPSAILKRGILALRDRELGTTERSQFELAPSRQSRAGVRHSATRLRHPRRRGLRLEAVAADTRWLRLVQSSDLLGTRESGVRHRLRT